MKIINSLILSAALILLSCHNNPDNKKETHIAGEFKWEYTSPESQGISSIKLSELIQDLSLKGTKKLLVIKNDKIVCEWFAPGYEDSVRGHYTASLAKALVGGMSLIAAIEDGYLNPDEPVCNYIPSWKNHHLKSKITIRQLMTHTSGMEDAEVSIPEQKEMIAKGLHIHMDLPGWKGQFWRQEPNPFLVSRDSAGIISTPGTRFIYSNPGIAMLSYAVSASLKKSSIPDIRTYLKERIYDPIGIKENEYSFGYGKTFDPDSLSLVPSWGGGNFTANAVARIGRLMLRKGNWEGVQLIDSSLVKEAIHYRGTGLPIAYPGNEPDDDIRTIKNPIPATTLGWYCNYDGIWKYVPRDAFVGAGAENQLLLVVPSLNMIIVRFGNDLFDKSAGEGFWLGAEKYLFNPVMESIEEAPYPQSNLITQVEFAPAETVIRLAEGSDNWPVTWADNNDLYTAYGDGYGFLPGTEIKLSLGLAKISGNPPDIKGINIRSGSGEKVGEGKFGPKASGILMIDGTLYMLVRNLKNARLAWSFDHGKTWKWADWQFGEGFGCPTFLNFGRNYNDARDKYVYIYSPDGNNAYDSFDQMVLARVNSDNIKKWESYEYFAGYKKNNKPLWSEDVRKCQPVFINPGKCYRSGITYNKGLKRYIWCQIIQLPSGEALQGPRFKGGLGIFEATDPWGPWKTVHYTMNWDIGPGESASIPTKWISKDGKSCYLLFSGDDHFSVRKMIFHLK